MRYAIVESKSATIHAYKHIIVAARSISNKPRTLVMICVRFKTAAMNVQANTRTSCTVLVFVEDGVAELVFAHT